MGLVAGVSARPLLEVSDGGGLAGVEERVWQAFAPRKGLRVDAERMEVIAHQVSVLVAISDGVCWVERDSSSWEEVVTAKWASIQVCIVMKNMIS